MGCNVLGVVAFESGGRGVVLIRAKRSIGGRSQVIVYVLHYKTAFDVGLHMEMVYARGYM